MVILCIIALIRGTAIVLQIINIPELAQAEAQHAIAAAQTSSGEPMQHSISQILELVIAVAMLIFLLGTFLEIWFFLVIINCFRYLRAKAAYEKETGISTPAINGIDAIFPLAERFSNHKIES